MLDHANQSRDCGTIGSKPGIDATIPPCGTPANPESYRGWPSLIKMDAAVKTKVEKLFNPQQPT